jgi:hypothetical protein
MIIASNEEVTYSQLFYEVAGGYLFVLVTE